MKKKTSQLRHIARDGEVEHQKGRGLRLEATASVVDAPRIEAARAERRRQPPASGEDFDDEGLTQILERKALVRPAPLGSLAGCW